MHHRNLVLLFAAVLVLGACSTVGETEVRVETGNQTSGFLTRPLILTASSDESVQEVAQRICDNVKTGSTARIAFVGKVPGPGPIHIADWGKYSYTCGPVPVAATPATAVVPPAVPAAAPAGAATAAVPAPQPAATTPSGTAVLTEAQEQHRRECQRKQGAYQICVGSCLASSSSASGVVESECAQRCAAQFPSGCN
jgi:hypothetical protein